MIIMLEVDSLQKMQRISYLYCNKTLFQQEGKKQPWCRFSVLCITEENCKCTLWGIQTFEDLGTISSRASTFNSVLTERKWKKYLCTLSVSVPSTKGTTRTWRNEQSCSLLLQLFGKTELILLHGGEQRSPALWSLRLLRPGQCPQVQHEIRRSI